MGLKLAMDDFGTGYSSLSYIQKMPISLLKLDRSFIMFLEDDLVAQEIVSAVIKIAKSKKIETIAEGTETEGQVEILERFGCDYAQGFLFGKPMKASELTDYLKRSKQLV
ncbi:MAG: EAL domain-containing protein, partial [Oscillospiraceae bacterium]|nr:EAL domain-containing protein [Oscillospiraceae bacterium]